MNYAEFAKAKGVQSHQLRIYKPVFEYLEANNWPEVTEALSGKWQIARVFGYERLINPNREDGKWHVLSGRQRVCLYVKTGSSPTQEAISAHLKYISNHAYVKIKKSPPVAKEKVFKCDRLNEANWPSIADKTLFYSSSKTAEHFGYEPIPGKFVGPMGGKYSIMKTESGKFVTLYKRKGDVVSGEDLAAYLLSR